MSCIGMDCGCWNVCNKSKKKAFLREMQQKARKLLADPTVTVTKFQSDSGKKTEK